MNKAISYRPMPHCPFTMAHQMGYASGRREVEGRRFCHPFSALQLRCNVCGPCFPACGRA
eukprot:1554534-Pyramimonas_sp.AAC.1